MIQGQIYENLALAGCLDPVTVVNSEVFSDVIDLRKFHKVLGTLLIGDIAAETVVFRAVTCDSAGNNVAALKTAETLAAHATNNDGKQILIEVDGADLPGTSNADRYIKFGVVTGGASGGPMSIAAQGLPKQLPADNHNLATVVEIEIDND